MSKTSLRKATAAFSADEMRQLLFDLYAKSKEAKEWLDFYADPDVAKKLEAYKKPILKEVERYSHHAHRPRLAKIRPIIKKFLIFDPGDPAVGELMAFTMLNLMRIGAEAVFPDTTLEQIDKFFGETLTFLHTRRLLDEYEPQFIRALEKMKDFRYYPNPLRLRLGSTLAQFKSDNP
ncbi:MAG: hypothetical protein K2K55_04350 [Duncaniella sp.]|nr:hypothetical protein [Duncaniella sp.]